MEQDYLKEKVSFHLHAMQVEIVLSFTDALQSTARILQAPFLVVTCHMYVCVLRKFGLTVLWLQTRQYTEMWKEWIAHLPTLKLHCKI